MGNCRRANRSHALRFGIGNQRILIFHVSRDLFTTFHHIGETRAMPPECAALAAQFRASMAHRVLKRLFQNALADGPEHEAEQASLEVLAVAYDDHVDVGQTIGTTFEGVPRRDCAMNEIKTATLCAVHPRRKMSHRYLSRGPIL